MRETYSIELVANEFFQRACNPTFKGELSPESLRANAAFAEYLRENVVASDVFFRLQNRIRMFQDVAPRVFVSKCIDGRVHTANEMGYPPSSIKFLRTEGSNLDLSASNTVFWNRLNSVVLDARRNTPDCPALFIAMAHRGEAGSGCAAHGGNDAAALSVVEQQACEVQKAFLPSELYVLYGMMNTDDRSLRLFFPDGHDLDTQRIIRTLNTQSHPLCRPADVFQPEFLDRLLDDRQTNQLVGGRVVRSLVEGPLAPMFEDLQVMIALETYLMTEVSRVVLNQMRNNVVFDDRVFHAVQSQVDSIDRLPEVFRAPLVYQMLWNVAFVLHERLRIESLAARERRLALDHAENMVAYGEGFEIEPRNTLVLIKPGRGRDLDALQVAKAVITKHRHNRVRQDFPPLVHINLEIAGRSDRWHAFNDEVLARLLTLTQNVHSVFQSDCRVLTTYSYRHQKRFYPVRLQPDPTLAGCDARESYPVDLSRDLSQVTFSPNDLRLREAAYTRWMLL